MKYDHHLTINGRRVGPGEPAYFVADIAANHDGDLERAKALIWACKEAGADAAKFQHFLARNIVSDRGFRDLGARMSHQAKWSKPVFEIYEDYECSRDWNQALVDTCSKAGIDFMTTPYDTAAIEMFAGDVAAFKIGSGDITWIESVERIAAAGKPVLMATGASSVEDVERAVAAVLAHNPQLCLMQCNTNYTGELENFKYINLNVIKSFAAKYPDMVLGLSDHTPGHATVLGAVALGASVIEKHFTDDTGREGPDHPFSMSPEAWREMVERTRELEFAMGDGVKRVEDNEAETALVQRRCIRAKSDIAAGTVLTEDHLECLRPAPEGAFAPYRLAELVGSKLQTAKAQGDAFYDDDLAG
ncbi:MAG: N-acetylneuraminate synthase family protein [Proteobacteria bacterium]|nr:N-acetylneuraminate synthase family protein [Pseudomonadota bacterium]